MAESIFSGDVTDRVQMVINRYELCQGLFGRAREINRAPLAEGETRPNPTTRAFIDYSRMHLDPVVRPVVAADPALPVPPAAPSAD